MLSLFADCLILASRLPNPESIAAGDRLRRREDEEWLMQSRATRFHAAQR